jgi:hypothetical protein
MSGNNHEPQHRAATADRAARPSRKPEVEPHGASRVCWLHGLPRSYGMIWRGTHGAVHTARYTRRGTPSRSSYGHLTAATVADS